MAVNNEDLAKQLRKLSNQLYELSEKIDPAYSIQLETLNRVHRWARVEYAQNGGMSIHEKHFRTKLLQGGITPQFLEAAFQAMITSGFLEHKEGTYPNRFYTPILSHNSQDA
jgi:hypothetical protein